MTSLFLDNLHPKYSCLAKNIYDKLYLKLVYWKTKERWLLFPYKNYLYAIINYFCKEIIIYMFDLVHLHFVKPVR